MQKRNIFQILGPGLLWAGAAIGVSHLVQSTRTGAIYGFGLIGVILLANVLKYPFFEFAPRYTVSTGESLLQGYKRLGNWAVILYIILTVSTMFAIQSAVTVVTAGLFSNVFNLNIDIFYWTVIILFISSLIILLGKYTLLDRSIKIIIILLAVATIFAVILAFTKDFNPNPEFSKHFEWNIADIGFLIALVGWMPSAIDISVWHSEWILAKKKETGYLPKLKEALLDFKIGYIGTTILSVSFLLLGALVMYGTGEEFSDKGVSFAGQLINLFTASLGNWSFYIIAIAALATMFSTTITCLDAYPRVLTPATKLIYSKAKKKKSLLPILYLALLIIGTLIIVKYFMTSMQLLVNIATTISFITAPILGYLNLKVVTGKNMPQENRPKKWLLILSWIGLIFLTGFSIYFLIWKLM